MLHLLTTQCSTDWKGRPSHTLARLGSGTIEELTVLMNRDIAEWQAEEIAEINKEAAEEGETPISIWYEQDVRWEMRIPEPKPCAREFAWNDGGEFSSLVYHLLEI